MSENNSLININFGDIDFKNLSKPANTLIKKITSAVGIFYEPTHIKRVAKAEAKAALIEAKSEIEISELHRRAAQRWVEEEAQRQKNMEDITAKALPNLNEDANPDEIEDDWIVNFFDKCRIVSNDEMQKLWSRILAGEANTPGTYSKRTVNFLVDLDKNEAQLFTKLCGFVWKIESLQPLIFEHQDEIYNSHGIRYESLNHLKNIGLIEFSVTGHVSIFRSIEVPKTFAASYYDRRLALGIPLNTNKRLAVGTVSLTHIGQELAPICGSQPVEGFWEYVKEQWKEYLPKVEAPG
ncbi:MAG: DUF2806 domain-containing protein [Candidatus Poribacteria bacterium]|nr:DUF2806 domain-containing protein [Candidatus Poribacteria bacterium]